MYTANTGSRVIDSINKASDSLTKTKRELSFLAFLNPIPYLSLDFPRKKQNRMNCKRLKQAKIKMMTPSTRSPPVVWLSVIAKNPMLKAATTFIV
jgi:hypothetical protein